MPKNPKLKMSQKKIKKLIEKVIMDELQPVYCN